MNEKVLSCAHSKRWLRKARAPSAFDWIVPPLTAYAFAVWVGAWLMLPHGHLAIFALLAMLALMLVCWRPGAVLLFATLVSQEINNLDAFHGTPLQAVGHELYFTRLGGQLSPMFLLAVTALIVTALRYPIEVGKTMTLWPTRIAAALLGWTLLLALAQFQGGAIVGDLRNSLLQGQSWLILAVSVPVGFACSGDLGKDAQ